MLSESSEWIKTKFIKPYGPASVMNLKPFYFTVLLVKEGNWSVNILGTFLWDWYAFRHQEPFIFKVDIVIVIIQLWLGASFIELYKQSKL